MNARLVTSIVCLIEQHVVAHKSLAPLTEQLQKQYNLTEITFDVTQGTITTSLTDPLYQKHKIVTIIDIQEHTEYSGQQLTITTKWKFEHQVTKQ